MNDARRGDVRRVLKYDANKLSWMYVGLGVAACATSLLLAQAGAERSKPLAWIFLVLGLAWTGFWLVRTIHPGKPLLELSPAGLRMRIIGATEFLIPWHDIEAIETIDVTVTHRGLPVTYEDVTAVVVRRGFYSKHVHVDSAFLRGPGWSATFIPSGDRMKIALHHGILSVKRPALHRAVVERWEAFRDAKRPDAPAG